MSDLLTPAQVTGPANPMGGQAMPSQLAMAMMHSGGAPNMQNPMGGIPLGTMLQLMNQQQQQGQPGLWTRMGNWLNGYSGNGMAGPGMLNDLSGQAAGNIAGGAAI